MDWQNKLRKLYNEIDELKIKIVPVIAILKPGKLMYNYVCRGSMVKIAFNLRILIVGTFHRW